MKLNTVFVIWVNLLFIVSFVLTQGRGDGSHYFNAGYSCKTIKQQFPNSKDGLYFVNFGKNHQATRVWCDMTTNGGGFTTIWKNIGGLHRKFGPNNSMLLASRRMDIVKPMYKRDVDFTPGINSRAYSFFASRNNTEWIKQVNMHFCYDYSLLKSFYVGLEMGNATMEDVFNARLTSCNKLGTHKKIRVYYNPSRNVNTREYLGFVTHINHESRNVYGVTMNNTMDDTCQMCGCNEFIDVTKDVGRYDGGNLGTTLKYLFSFSHEAPHPSRNSECAFQCDFEFNPILCESFVWSAREDCGFGAEDCSFLGEETTMNNTIPELQNETITCFGILQNDTLVCSGRGICINNDECLCMNGWRGDNCTDCPEGWSGENCLECSSEYYCNSRGKCVTNHTETDTERRYLACECISGYTGTNCSTELIIPPLEPEITQPEPLQPEVVPEPDEVQPLPEDVKTVATGTNTATISLTVSVAVALVTGACFANAYAFILSFILGQLFSFFQSYAIILKNKKLKAIGKDWSFRLYQIFFFNFEHLFENEKDDEPKQNQWYKSNDYFVIKCALFIAAIIFWNFLTFIIQCSKKRKEKNVPKNENTKDIKIPNPMLHNLQANQANPDSPTGSEQIQIVPLHRQDQIQIVPLHRQDVSHNQSQNEEESFTILEWIEMYLKKGLLLFGPGLYTMILVSCTLQILNPNTTIYPPVLGYILSVIAGFVLIYMAIIIPLRLFKTVRVNSFRIKRENKEQMNSNPFKKRFYTFINFLRYRLFVPPSRILSKIQKKYITVYSKLPIRLQFIVSKITNLIIGDCDTGKRFQIIFSSILKEYHKQFKEYAVDIILLKGVIWFILEISLMQYPNAQVIVMILIQFYFLLFVIIHLPNRNWHKNLILIFQNFILFIQICLMALLIVNPANFSPLIASVILNFIVAIIGIAYTIIVILCKLLRRWKKQEKNTKLKVEIPPTDVIMQHKQ